MTVKSITKITDHVARAIARLPTAYKSNPTKKYTVSWSGTPVSGWEAMLYAFIKPAQDLEDILYKMLTERGLQNAVGINLDRLGEIVGLPRKGLSDTVYRARIYVQIATNISDGTPPDIIKEIWQRVITADDVIYFESHPAKFYGWLKNPSLSLDYDFLRLVTREAKATGVGLEPFVVSQFLPYLGFTIDTDADSGPYGVLKQDQNIVSYSDYDFADNGAITDTDRFSISTATTAGLTSYYLHITLDTTAGPLFDTELTTEMAINGGLLKLVDSNGVTWEFISDGNMVVDSQTVSGNYRLTLEYVTDDVINGEVRVGGIPTPYQDTFLLGLFGVYTQADEATFNTNNPDGLIKSADFDVEVETLTYYTAYTFPTTYGGSGYSRAISANRYSFPSRYELLVTQDLGADTTNFLAEVNSSAVGFSVVDNSGVLWEYVGTLNLSTTVLTDGVNPVATDFRFEITLSDGTELGTMYRNGLPVSYGTFFTGFDRIDLTDAAAFATNNPNGLGNAVSASEAIGGSYYSVLK